MVLAAIVEERRQEALGFAGSAARGQQRVEGRSRTEAPKGLLLVDVGREGQGELGKPVAAGTLLEGQGHRGLGRLAQPLAVGEEAIDQPP